MEFSKKIYIIIILFLIAIAVLGFYFILKSSNTNLKDFIFKTSGTSSVPNFESKPPKDLPTKKESTDDDPSKDSTKPLPNNQPAIKAVYITSVSAASKSYISYLDQLFQKTQINSVVIDIKDYSGIVFYNTKAEKVREYKNFRQDIIDINKLIEHFHSQGIYVIARINIFNDSALAKDRPDLALYSKSRSNGQPNNVLWQDNSGLSWLDPASEEVWDYNIEIAKDALSRGFDEVNFDYIRFPSDGNIEDVGYPIKDATATRSSVVKKIFKKIRESLPNVNLSVDLFGQTTTTADDMGVGQIFEDAFDYFDYICPMIYPSHYANGFLRYENPAEHPYEIVKNALDRAILRRSAYTKENPEKQLAKIRPWIQDFDLGADYDANMVKQEIKAVEDAMKEDFNGFMLWNPSNIYTIEAIALE